MMACMSIAILMLKLNIFHLSTMPRKKPKKTCCKQHILARSKTPSHFQEVCEILFLNFFILNETRQA